MAEPSDLSKKTQIPEEKTDAASTSTAGETAVEVKKTSGTEGATAVEESVTTATAATQGKTTTDAGDYPVLEDPHPSTSTAATDETCTSVDSSVIKPTNVARPFATEKRRLGKSSLMVSTAGVGTAGLSGLHGTTDEEESKAAIIYAINSGVNFIDTAPFYNCRKAENLLKDIIGQFKREDLCIATKVGRYMEIDLNTNAPSERFDYSAAATRESVKESMECMGLSYIDVVQIHDVEFAPTLDVITEETIPTLVQLKEEGLIKAIGITGYSTRHLRRVAEECGDNIDVVMSYLRHNFFDTSLSSDLRFYKDSNIAVINASPLAIGLLTNHGNVPSWNPASDEVKDACNTAAEHCGDDGVCLETLAIRHSMDEPGITMTLWSSRKTGNMRANLASALLPLTPREQRVRKMVSKKLSGIKNNNWEDRLNEYHPFFAL